MQYQRLVKLSSHVVAASKVFSHRSCSAIKRMNFVPPTAVSKLGLVSTFIFGAAVGSQLKKYLEKSSQFMHDDKRNLHTMTNILRKEFTLDNESEIITKIHKALQKYYTCPLVDDSMTQFYIEKASKSCHAYLSSKGLLETSSELRLEEWFEEAEQVDSTDYWAPLPSLRQRRIPSYSSTLYFAIRALWYISKLEDRCDGKGFVDADLLQILKLLIDANDCATTSLVLKVLANIAAVKQNHQFFFNTGLIDVLQSYSENSHPELFLPAWRGLHNLKQTNGKTSKNQEVYTEGVYPFNPPWLDQVQSPKVDVILVHGIKGGASFTWREHDQGKFKPLISQEDRRKILSGHYHEAVDSLYSCCWPLDWLVASLDVPIRILAVDYNAEWQTSSEKFPIEARGKTISQHAADIAESLKAARVGDRPIIWLCHSMGGLIVKQILSSHQPNIPEDMFIQEEKSHTSCNSLAKQSAGVVFFSVPHHGSPLASYVSKPLVRQVLHPTVEVSEMKEDSSLLSDVHKSFKDVIEACGTAVLTLNESQPMRNDFLGLDAYFVPSKCGDPGIGAFYEVDASHLDICKPHNKNSVAYQKVIGFFKEILTKI